MNDDDFIASLESCGLPSNEFGHTAHVRAAYLYLRTRSFPEALAHMAQTVRNYAANLGKSDKYHETITVAFLALIHQHLAERGDFGDWSEFARQNPSLLEAGLLLQFYPREQLDSDIARKVFVLPRRQHSAAR